MIDCRIDIATRDKETMPCTWYIRALLCGVLFCLVGSGRGLPIDLTQTIPTNSTPTPSIKTANHTKPIWQVLELSSFMPYLAKGLEDKDDVQLLSHQILAKVMNAFHPIPSSWAVHMRVYVDAIVCVSLYINQLNIPI